ncbi:MAG: T9SS type A sorting domain-containing protein, partial [Bacteroidales bacterium]|nr:T9SS type A sorting domain-containing protein [Bacteroidales bacterium]
YQNYFTFAGFEDTTLNKDIIVTGQYSSSTSRDVTLMLLNPSSGFTNSYIKFDNNSQWEEGYAIMPLIQGGYLISGYTGSSHYEAYIIRVDDNFNKLWDKQYNYGELYINQNFPTGRKDFVVIQTADTGFAFLGRPQNAYDIKLMKTDSSGTIEWIQIYGGTDHEEPCSIQQTNDKGFVIVGYTTSYGAGSKDVYLLKTDSVGNIVTTGLNDYLKQSLNVYPNPVNDVLYIHGECGNKAILSSIDGKLLEVFDIISNNDKIDLNGYLQGVYLLKVITNEGIKVKKLIIN